MELFKSSQPKLVPNKR